MGRFEHNRQSYPRLQFWQIDDAYFENPDIINKIVQLPIEWRIRPSQKSEPFCRTTGRASAGIGGVFAPAPRCVKPSDPN